MGVIRGGLLAIVVFVLFLSLLATSVVWTFDLSLTHENVRPEMISLVNDLVEEEFNVTEIFSEELTIVEEYCQNNTEYVFSAQGETFVIPCSIVSQGLEPIIENSVGDYVDRAYYEDYSCNFWNCLQETGKPFFLISQKAKEYWHGKFILLLFGSLILIGLAFLLVEHKPNFLMLVGVLLVLSSFLFQRISRLVLSLIDESFLKFFVIFFSAEGTVFLVGLIVGGVALGLGIIFRFLLWERVKKKFSKSDVKEIVKKEVAESKKKSEKQEKQKDFGKNKKN